MSLEDMIRRMGGQIEGEEPDTPWKVPTKDNCVWLTQLGALPEIRVPAARGECPCKVTVNNLHCCHRFPGHRQQCCLCERVFDDPLSASQVAELEAEGL